MRTSRSSSPGSTVLPSYAEERAGRRSGSLLRRLLAIATCFAVAIYVDAALRTLRRSGEPPKAAYQWRGADVTVVLPDDELEEVIAICKRVRWRSIERFITEFPDRVFVATGDIDDMWLRDSAVQMMPYTHVGRLRPLVEKYIVTCANFILADPYANSYRRRWKKAEDTEIPLRRGGWVGTGNWEVDSHAYFLSFISDSGSGHMLAHTSVAAAVSLVLDTLIVEQNHAERSPYVYVELPRGGRGGHVNYTGMVWGGFRPSDDQQRYGYNVPVNMLLHAALTKLAAIHDDPRIGALLSSIDRGIQTFGVVDGCYVYEVDGLGNHTAGFDDANLPSLLSIPLTGYENIDREVYERTRARLLSPANQYFFQGDLFEGVGSPHTPHGYVWPLAVVVRALTAGSSEEATAQFRYLLNMQCSSGTMHESVSVHSPDACTREDFEWANTMFVNLVDTFYPGRCDVEINWRKLDYAAA